MRIEITVLVENTADKSADLKTEHGLAFFINFIDINKKILFDTGASGEALLYNAGQLGIDLKQLDAVVISHAHYDHAGGLPALLGLFSDENRVPVYAHPDLFAFTKLWRQLPDGDFKRLDARLDQQKFLLKNRANPIPVHESQNLFDNPRILISGPLRSQPNPQTAGSFFRGEEGRERPDNFEHEISLLVKGEEGWILIVGCAHHGIMNILHHAQESLTQNEPIRTVAGGLHTHRASAEELDALLGSLREAGVERVIAGHCTGEEIFNTKSQKTKLRIYPLMTGRRYSF